MPPVFWIRRPIVCSQKGCDGEPRWVVFYAPEVGAQPVFDAVCDEHADDAWLEDPVHVGEDGDHRVAVHIGEPTGCTYFGGAEEPCGRPEAYIAVYPAEDGASRIGHVCSVCAARRDDDPPLADGEILFVSGDMVVPFEDAFEPPNWRWWERYVVNPELGLALGEEYADTMARVTATWADLFWVSARGALLGLIPVLAMVFVPRGAFWILLGALTPLVAMGIGQISGLVSVKKNRLVDSDSETTIEGSEMVARIGDTERGPATEFRVDILVGILAFFVVFVSPPLIYAALLILIAGAFGIGYGHTVAASGLVSSLAFLGIGVVCAGIVTFAVRFTWNLIILIPLLFHYWFMGGDD